MKKVLLVVFLALFAVQLVGCRDWLVRTEASRKIREDQEISGNRGFISGQAPSPPKEPAFTDRKVYKVEVEIPEWPWWKKDTAEKESTTVPKKDDVLWGNRGYIFGGPQAQTPKVLPQPQPKKRPVTAIKKTAAKRVEPKAKPKPQQRQKAKLRSYKVRKGDTLQKISRKFYGTTKKWLLVYKANKNKLKNPDSVYPGQVLIIPEVDNYKK